MSLPDRIALVSGSSRGLGRAIGLALAEAGADVIVNTDHDLDAANSTADLIRALGRRSLVIQADVSNETTVVNMFGQIHATFGRLDILVNNAGITQSQDIFETSLEDWHRVIDTNLTSCFLCSREAMKLMRQQRSGRIVNITSIVGQRGALFGHVHYASTKSGMIGFTKTLARTCAPLGITVNAVAPGIIDTDLLRRTHGDQQVEELAKTVPLGLGQPRDIGLAVAFLCGEGGRYITGATLDVNGGMNFR